MKLNWFEEIKRIDPDIKFRAQGGWLKTVEKLDKTVKNGYSLVGDFVKAGDFEEEYDEGLYLDCNKEGTTKKISAGLQTIPFQRWESKTPGYGN